MTLTIIASLLAPASAEPPPSPPPTAVVEPSPAARIPDTSRLRAWHDLLAFEPQVAGTEGDLRSIEVIDAAFDALGLDSEPWWFRPLLAHPVSASLEIVETGSTARSAGDSDAPEHAAGDVDGGPFPATNPEPRRTIPLPIRERILPEDPATAHPDLDWGWNAFSGSGEVEAEIVYVNRGLEADYAQLRAWGVDVSGRIVLARYGGAYRGHKVRNAVAAGAAGVLLYTDPADSGAGRGGVWPEGGGWANESFIQRGSVLTRAQPGDVLTPFEPALADAARRPIDEAGLFEIPVQPIGHAAAGEIMRRMTGREVAALPGGEAWRNGLDPPGRVEGGPALRIRMKVEQERRLADTANVIASIEGALHPEQLVVIGCHHDAWGFGAGDPHAGTIALMEVARAFGELAARGVRPERTLVFAAWGAEEHGIIGSTEWVEAHRDRLAAHGVAYLNLDMAAMGPNFSMSASPSLRAAARRAAAATPAARDDAGRSVLARAESGEGEFRPGTSGGGSDHVAFVGHVAMPAATIHAGGSDGVAYHSNYDTLAWYRAIVGEDYEPALMIARYTANLATLLAFEPILPLRCEAVARDAAATLRALEIPEGFEALAPRIGSVARRLDGLADRGAAIDARLDELSSDPAIPEAQRVAIDGALLALDRVWWDERGLFDRPWYRNLSIAPDRFTGYGAAPLPILSEPIADGDLARTTDGLSRLAAATARLDGVLATLETATGIR